jgi:hypothetical protein
MFRQMIRVTWGNEAYLEHINASLLFVVGRYPSLKIQFALEQESRKSVYASIFPLFESSNISYAFDCSKLQTSNSANICDYIVA